MSNIINFNFESKEIRTVLCKNGNPLFHATDLAVALNFKNPRQAIASHIDTEDLVKIEIATKGGMQKASFTNESGMYSLIFGSTKDEAKKFKRWVTSEVLPTIRKTGQYRHTISAQQQAQIQQAIKTKCQHNKVHYQTLYHALYHAFSIPRYSELLACDFERALAFIWGFEFTPSLNTAFIANILADNAHQIKQAQDEFWGVMGDFRNVLEHLDKLQRRLEKSERCIQALQKQLI